MQWQQVDDIRDENCNSMSSQSSGFSNIVSPNPYRELIVDDESNFEVKYQKNVTSKFVNTAPTYIETRQPSIVTKQNPENDDPLRYKALKFLPGNSTYASVNNKGKKIAMLNDSLCSGIKLHEFNHYIKNGYAYLKLFPGATIKDLDHHCELSLRDDKPDACVINIGSNNLGKYQPYEIAKQIINVVNKCHEHGVKKVYVLPIPMRMGKERDVQEVYNFLRAKSFLHDLILIDISNVKHYHSSRDNIHLNYDGTVMMANNFIRAINGTRVV